MRVLVVSAWNPGDLTDGTVWVLHHQLRELGERHELTVLNAASLAPKRPSLDYAIRRVRGLLSLEPAHVYYVERQTLIGAIQGSVRGTRPPDVIYAFGWGTARTYRWAGDVPVVHAPVDAWSLGRGNRSLPGWRSATDVGESTLISRHEAKHYPRCAAVTVVSNGDAEQLRRLAPTARIEIVPNGVDVAGSPAALPADPVVGFHGNFTAAHNVDGARRLARDIWPRVHREVPSARLLIAGRSPGPEVTGLADPSVEVAADVADMRSVIDRMSVEVSFMSTGTGIKNKVLEAMAAGRGVIANQRGASGIPAGDGLILVEDPASAAETVVALLKDRQRMQQLGAAARSRVERDWTWAGSAQKLEHIWESVAR